MEQQKWVMEFPILADNHGDLWIFDSRQQAEDWMEPQDVEAHEYKVYDSKGRLLEVGVKDGRTVVWAGDEERFYVDELRAELIRYIIYVSRERKRPKSQTWLKQATLEQLVKIRRDYER